jgi:desulfoferrodoxin (superoxide reductase-like protein)
VANASVSEYADSVPSILRAEIAALESKGVRTAAAPGQWAGLQARRHAPRCDFKDGTVTVSASEHQQSADDWIEYIYAKDSTTGKLLGAIKLARTDGAAARSAFAVPAGTRAVTGYNVCRAHGVWASAATPVASSSSEAERR